MLKTFNINDDQREAVCKTKLRTLTRINRTEEMRKNRNRSNYDHKYNKLPHQHNIQELNRL